MKKIDKKRKKIRKPAPLYLDGTRILIAEIEQNGNIFIDSLRGRSEYEIIQFERLHEWLGKALLYKEQMTEYGN